MSEWRANFFFFFNLISFEEMYLQLTANSDSYSYKSHWPLLHTNKTFNREMEADCTIHTCHFLIYGFLILPFQPKCMFISDFCGRWPMKKRSVSVSENCFSHCFRICVKFLT